MMVTNIASSTAAPLPLVSQVTSMAISSPPLLSSFRLASDVHNDMCSKIKPNTASSALPLPPYLPSPPLPPLALFCRRRGQALPSLAPLARECTSSTLTLSLPPISVVLMSTSCHANHKYASHRPLVSLFPLVTRSIPDLLPQRPDSTDAVTSVMLWQQHHNECRPVVPSLSHPLPRLAGGEGEYLLPLAPSISSLPLSPSYCK
ncbi:hypothetical protein BDQ17DRAFT_1551338 [Cyathus striatus]|nr:hypothetical protein BDQ17DRAFT_1551338 [Cyathus striatus]